LIPGRGEEPWREAWAEVIERLAAMERDLAELRNRVAPGHVLECQAMSASSKTSRDR